MRHKFFVLFATAAGLVAVQACGLAENVTIHTEFPSPYGAYGTVTAAGNSDFGVNAGEVQVAATGGGCIVIGEPACGTAFLTAIGNVNGQHTAAFRMRNGWGVEAGGFAGIGPLSQAGSIQANNGPGAGGPLIINSNGGNMGVGVAAPAYTLHVNGTIGKLQGGNSGELRFCPGAVGDNSFYGCYAP